MGQRVGRGRTLGVRAVAAAAALVVAVSGLTACRTNVGNAATIDGQRISESDVNDYVTASAKPIQGSGGSAGIAPKPFVIDILIQRRLLEKVLAAAPSGTPSAGQLTTLRRQYLAGDSVKAKVETLGVTGYPATFNGVLVDAQVLSAVLQQERQQGLDVAAILKKLSFRVSINPRYGTWDKQNLQVVADTTSGLPSYLKLQGASTSQP